MNSKYRKIKYIPGFISILLLPTLCILYLKINSTQNNLSGIEINQPIIWFTDNNTIWRPEDIIPTRSFIIFNIDGSDLQTKLQLDSARSLLNKLFELKDTVNGIHFNFKSNSKYWSYIEVLDICLYNKSNYFFNFKRNIWVWYRNENINNTIPPINMGADLMVNNDINSFDSNTTKYIWNWENIKGLVILFWPSIILFLAMMLLSYKNIISIQKGSQ